MQVRGLWLFDSKITHFSKRYPNVENRFKSQLISGYKELPTNDNFISLIKTTLQRQRTFNCVQNIDGFWPVVILERGEFVYACSLAIDPEKENNDIIDLPEITSAISFLNDLVGFVQQQFQEISSYREIPFKMAELNNFLTFALPFGTRVDTSISNAKNSFKAQPPDKNASQKQPSWKPVLFKGKSLITLTLKEQISAVQYDMESIPDVLNMSGTILCKAELEGIPDVTMNLSFSNIDNVIFHPCIQAADLQSSKKIIFSPPLDPFPLCNFRVKKTNIFPLRGFYQMKEVNETTLKVLVQIKLHESINNNFEYCQLRMPFSNRGIITNVEITPTTGTIYLSQNKKTIIWNIGPKFLGRNREAALPGTVYFQKEDENKDKQFYYKQLTENNDPFCIDSNAFVSLHFKVLDESLTKTSIDPQSIAIYPNAKAKVVINRELEASEYIIWNSIGNARSSLVPTANEQV